MSSSVARDRAAGSRDPRRGWLIHAAAFATANPLIFLLQRRRGDFRVRGAAIQLASWGAGLGYHYLKAVHRPARAAAAD